MKAGYTEYAQWELSQAELPPRSRLFPLAPLGRGTAQAECLTSYLMRLAAAHCLSPGTLHGQVIYPALRGESKLSALTTPSRPAGLRQAGTIQAAHCWNGADKSAANHVRVLERLTCVRDLQGLTWLPWGTILARQSLLRQQRAWCPACLSQWQAEGQTIY